MKPTALYIHIPFCEHKCIYCDFYSVITDNRIPEYLTAIKTEISSLAKEYSERREIISIFFGGGTPSLLEPYQIADLLQFIYTQFYVSPNVEITLETNPGTVSFEKLKLFKASGINRLSIGIQSFNNEELKFLTRIHDKDSAIRTVNEASLAGFNNINIDLIFNLPGQTKEIWKSNLNEAVNLPVTHISAYSLILEPGTVLNKLVIDKKVELQDEDYDAGLYEETISFLNGKGFVQYEVSNFAKPGYECSHNNSYWNYSDYLGVGTGAHSFVKNHRWWNYRNLSLYIEKIKSTGLAAADTEVLSAEQMIDEYIMLGLRSSGLDTEELNKRFSFSFGDEKEIYIKSLIDSGHLTPKGSHIKMTPLGYPVCDEIVKNLIS